MGKPNKKKVYTTGEVARILGVNINTVIKWYEEGKIEGFRLPTSQDRRIPIGSLRKFMEQHSIPMDLLQDDGPMRRNFDRHSYNGNVEIALDDNQDSSSFQAKLHDISQGGARLEIDSAAAGAMTMSPGGLRLSFLEGPLTSEILEGQIVHLQSKNERLTLGLKFDEFNQEKRAKLSDFLQLL